MMMENNRTRVFGLLGEVLVAALLASGLTVLTAESAGIAVSAYKVYLGAIAAAIALFGLSYSRASGWVTLLLMVLGALITVFFGWKPLTDFKGFLDQVYGGGSLIQYADAFSVLALILLIAAFYIMAHQRAGAYLMLFITLVLLGILWFFGDVTTSIHILPVIAALSAMFSKTAGFRFSSLRPLVSLSLVSAILAVAIVPGEGVKVDQLNDYAQKALAFMIRTFNIDNKNMEERRSFTIASDGWASHKELIGGNAYPSEGEVMEIRGEAGEVYLRGALRYVYNNNAWVDESNESKAGKIKRYMFSGFEKLIYKSEFERAMDHDKKGLDRYFDKSVLNVKMLQDSQFWTLYTPNRVTDVKVGDDAFVYFNNVGELFINRQVRENDEFEIEYKRLSADKEEIERLIYSLAGKKDEGYTAALVLNKDLPSGIDQSIYELTYRIIQNAVTPYEKAAAISDYLKANGTYTLASGYPGENMDAVSFFVNEGMNGYCVHFASTMAVMARIAGLPARYVEGYRATIDENGECTVTGLDAHAWTEVYFNGFGWLTFDPTPARAEEDENDNGDGDAPDEGVSDNQDESGHDQDQMNDDEDTPDGLNEPTPTPTPEPTPEPTNTPEPDTNDGANDADVWGEPTPTPTPNPGRNSDHLPDSRNDQPDDPNDQNDREDSKGKKIILLVFLAIILILAFIAFVWYRLTVTRPEQAERRMKNAEDRLMCWYRAMLTALEASALRYEAGDTPITFASRALERRMCTEEFTHFSDIVTRRRYSESTATNEEYKTAAYAYKGIVRLMPLFARIRWYIRRILRGIGRVNQIP